MSNSRCGPAVTNFSFLTKKWLDEAICRVVTQYLVCSKTVHFFLLPKLVVEIHYGKGLCIASSNLMSDQNCQKGFERALPPFKMSFRRVIIAITIPRGWVPLKM